MHRASQVLCCLYPFTPVVRLLTTASTRGIASSGPCCKGRKGGFSGLRRPKPITRSTKVPGAGKKKKPKVHGEPFSRIAKNRKDEERAKRQAERLKGKTWDEGIPPFEV
ncbi:unnamed protein product [Ectocarpus sp. 12 AP-2014]